MRYEYVPKGVCSRRMIIDVTDGVIDNLEVIGGCSGNLTGISILVKGMKIVDVISKLEHVKCGRKSTSCPAQLAVALKEIEQNKVCG